jgi:hypothetical protein
LSSEGKVQLTPHMAAKLVINVSKFNVCRLPKHKVTSPASIVFCMGGALELIMRG